jgi:hypothetical protein
MKRIGNVRQWVQVTTFEEVIEALRDMRLIEYVCYEDVETRSDGVIRFSNLG